MVPGWYSQIDTREGQWFIGNEYGLFESILDPVG